MKKHIVIMLAALAAFAGFSVFAADVGVRINGVDLIAAEWRWVSEAEEEMLAGTEVFNYNGVDVEEFIWSLQGDPATDVPVMALGSDLRPMEFNFTTDDGVAFNGVVAAKIKSQDVRMVFDSFVAGPLFSFATPEHDVVVSSERGKICYVFGPGFVAETPNADDIFEPLAENDAVSFEFAAGSRFSFDVSRYLPATQCAVPVAGYSRDIWEVRNVETKTQFTGSAIGGTFPGKGMTGEAEPATSITIKVGSGMTLGAKVKRSGETQPLIDASAGDSGIFYGSLDGYEGVQNVVVVKSPDGMVVTEVNDFKNQIVYKTITIGGNTTAIATQRQLNLTEANYPHERHVPPEVATTSPKLAAEYARGSSVSGPVYVDMLVAYDKSARKFVANEDGSGITNFAQTAVGKMNLTLLNSGLEDKFRFRLLGVLVVDDDVHGDFDVALDNVVYKLGKWTAVTEERDRIGADLVSILIDTGDAYGWTGLGYSLEGNLNAFKDYGINACAVRSVAISETMTHEVGHNMGAGHADAEHMETEYGPQYEACSSGYYFTAGGVKYHTIMAYDTDKNFNYYYSVPYFSTPAKTCQNVKVGDATHDNAGTLAKTFLAISGFRAPGSGIIPSTDDPVDPADSGDPVDPGTETDPTEVDDQSVPVVLSADVVSGYSVDKAVKLMGCTLDAANHPTGLFELKIGKANRKTGLSKISGSYTPLGGKKVTLKAVEKKGVDIMHGKATANFTLKGLENMSIVLGANAAGQLVFAGRQGEAGVSSVQLTAPEGVKHFTIDSLPSVLNGVEINRDYLPTSENGGEAIDMNGKWTCAKAMTVKYKKLKGETVPSWVENNGKLDGEKTNRSGLKLTYAEKKGTFKGSFTAYGLANGKFKKLKFTVTGVVVAGKVFGVSTFKKVNYECVVK